MYSLAVVPIFVSAGAAVLPTLLGALAGAAAILLKPWELWGLCRRRPGAAVAWIASLGVMVGGVSLIVHVLNRPVAKANSVDWTAVGEQILNRERLGQTATTAPAATPVSPVSPPVSQSGVDVAQVQTPPVRGLPGSPGEVPPSHGQAAAGEFARTNSDGGPSPEKLTALWTFRPEETMFLSRPVAFGDRVYVAGSTADLGDYTGVLACLNAQTGKPVWQNTEAGGNPLKAFYSSPALTADGKFLVIGQGLHTDANCSLLCFDAAKGQLKWAVKTPLHIESSPAIHGDMAVVGAGAIEGADGRPVGDPGFVLAVRISDGKVLWKQAVNDPESSPAIDGDGMVYIGSGFNGNAIVAIRSEPDEVLKAKGLSRVAWKREVSLPVTGEITLAGDLVLAGSGNGDFVKSAANPRGMAIALDKKTGEVRWETAIGDSVIGTVAFKDGLVLCPSRTGEVVALDAANGNVKWRARVSGKTPVLAGPAVTGKRVYAVASDGLLAVMDVSDGKVLEKIALNDSSKGGSGLTGCPPQVVGGRVIAGSETGGIKCLAGARSLP